RRRKRRTRRSFSLTSASEALARTANSDHHSTEMNEEAHLVLADGTVFPGLAFGARGTTVGEAVFTTTMSGYQEVLTDPSYCGQLVVMTAPEIGNVGTNDADTERVGKGDLGPQLAGFVVRDASPIASNWR